MDDKTEEVEEFDVSSLADALLGKEEDKKDDDKAVEEDKSDTGEEDKSKEEEKSDDDTKTDSTESDGDKAEDDKTEGESTEEIKPLSREDIRAALREERDAREQISTQRLTLAGQVRSDLKEALKLDSSYTTVALDDGTPISSVSQLTQVINPATDEPYTREEAASLLLDGQRIVNDNLAAYEKRVDELTDLNVNFKEEADEVDRLYGDIFKAFPDVAKDLLEAYQKTFTTSADGQYVENVPVSPMEFYGPALRPYRNATDQVNQQQAEAKAVEEKAAKAAATKAEQEDRGDLGATAGAAQGKPNLLGDALDNYIKEK
jgi:hypothetical protein